MDPFHFLPEKNNFEEKLSQISLIFVVLFQKDVSSSCRLFVLRNEMECNVFFIYLTLFSRRAQESGIAKFEALVIKLGDFSLCVLIIVK